MEAAQSALLKKRQNQGKQKVPFLHPVSPFLHLSSGKMIGMRPRQAACLPRQVGGHAGKSESRGLCLVFSFLPTFVDLFFNLLFQLVPALFIIIVIIIIFIFITIIVIIMIIIIIISIFITIIVIIIIIIIIIIMCLSTFSSPYNFTFILPLIDFFKLHSN